ncbi:LexA family transcriptional regulator [Thermobacillus composti]|uniref:hypothetical protein n=1 Tax=Thermobacillus composti TaxID=377615 RepID=UPI0005A43061|nr:hypothetical protein [Thermobacillus composti]
MMLSDRDRKLLRIIANYSAGRGRFPTLKELQIKSGRSRPDVMAGLKVLEQERYCCRSRNLTVEQPPTMT